MAEPSIEKTTAKKSTETSQKVRPLVKKMYADAHEAQKNGTPTAYSFVASLNDEIMRAMDVTPIWTENYAGLCAAKRDATRFLQKAKSEGYPNDLCTYALCGLGFDAIRKETGEMPLKSPDGGMPLPTMMLGTGMMVCDPRYKWFQSVRRYFDVPYYGYDLMWPAYPCDLKAVRSYYTRYMVDELRGLVAFMEKTIGRKMNWDKLSEVVDLAEKTKKIWWEAYDLRKAVPAPMPSEDAFNTMVPGFMYLGTQTALDFYTELYNEVKTRVDNGTGVIPDEKYRILWANGLPPWHSMMLLNFFESLGAVFPIEVNYRPFEPVEIPAGINDPLERMAIRFIHEWTEWYERADQNTHVPSVELLLHWIDKYKIDGIFMHRSFSCRTVHVGEFNQLNILKKYCDLPQLTLESDMVDVTSYSEEKVKTQITAYIETIDVYKKKHGK